MCGGASLARTSAQQKVGDFRSDPKADAALVDAWTETEKQLNGERTQFYCADMCSDFAAFGQILLLFTV